MCTKKNAYYSLLKLVLLALILVTVGAPSAWATRTVKTNFITAYPSADESRLDTLPSAVNHCGVCHFTFGSGGELNPYGAAIASNGTSSADILAIGSQDSDGDGYTNDEEIKGIGFINIPTFPGLTRTNVSKVTGVTLSELKGYLVPYKAGADCNEDADCDDEFFCTGIESCSSETSSCVASPGDPCVAPDTCNEGTDTCDAPAECTVDGDCDDGEFCNGDETCDNETCLPGSDPCEDNETCNEDADTCDEPCTVDDNCTDGLNCNGVETCDNGTCAEGTYACEANQDCQEADNGSVICEDKDNGNLQITKAKVKAGKDGGGDSIELSGTLDASEEDLDAAVGDTIIVSLEAEYIPGEAIEYRFPVEEENIKKNKYIYKDQGTVNPMTKLEIDTVKGTIKFFAKKDDLTGLSCPFIVTVEIADWSAEDELVEELVNGKKPCPLSLLMYVDESLEVTKAEAKQKSAPESDSISIEGTFTIKGSFDTEEPVIITIGSNTFTVPAEAFVEKNGAYKCNNAETESGNGLVTATFDYAKATYKISIKNADFTTGGAFSINIFGNLLVTTDEIPTE